MAPCLMDTLESETIIHNERGRILSSEPVVKGWINVHRLKLIMPDGVAVERHVEDHGPGVAVLPYDERRRVALLISQPRAAVLMAGCEPVLEVIAGRLDDASAEDRARQEALEEGGVICEILDHVTCLWSMPSISTERLDLYLAPYTEAARVSPGGGCVHEHENIEVHEIALAKLSSDAAAGRLPDAKTLILIQALQIRRPDLFV